MCALHHPFNYYCCLLIKSLMSYFYLGKSALRHKPTDQITTTHDKFGSGGADGRALYIADFERHLSEINSGTK
jgi:hypothetical protein